MARQTESDIEYIRAVTELFKETGLAELSVRREFGDGNGKLALRLSRHSARVAPVDTASSPPVSLAPAAVSPPDPEVAPAEPEGDSEYSVTSPMVGTAYLGPEPGADPFVKPGDEVQAGAALLIVEAMKTMNFIEAPRAGTIRQVLVDDGEPVEYGTPLVLLD